MPRCLTLGISLCLLTMLTGCCCGQRCGLFRGGCYTPSPCNPCAQPFGAMAPIGGCNSCGTGMAPPGYGAPPAYGTPYGEMPSSYVTPYNATTMTTDGATFGTAAAPTIDSTAMSAYPQPTVDQMSYGQPAYGQAAPFSSGPVTTALRKPDSLPTY